MLQDNNHLVHYGIQGQKWGIRRFQNEDGTLTEEGKRRYYLKSTEINENNSETIKTSESSDLINDKAKKIIIGLGSVALVAAAGYTFYKLNKNQMDLSNVKKISSLFEDSVLCKTNSEIVNNLTKEFKEKIEPNLSKKEKDAIFAYTKDDYSGINYLLEMDENGKSPYALGEANRVLKEKMQNPDLLKRCREEIDTITGVLDRTKTTEDMVVSRKTKFSYVRGMFGNDISGKELARLLSHPEEAKGKILRTKGFCSTSVDPSSTGIVGSCILQILVPKGSKGMFVAPISNSPNELEFLLQQNSKFKLVDVKSFIPDSESIYFSTMEIFLELINDN